MDQYRVEPDSNFRLAAVDPSERRTHEEGKRVGKSYLKKLTKRLRELQALLHAQGRHRVLIVLQAMDSGGKDGVIKHVFRSVNPQGVKVTSFKVPSSRERAHDYLWRVHRETPGLGEIRIFNRSHYEDVLVVRVHGMVPESTLEKRYGHIRDFERMLADEGTTILKFFLHISREEQARRLQSRLDTPYKHWKFSAADLEERKHWDAYLQAFEIALNRTSTEQAPWYVIPANYKWYRNLVIARILVERLEGLEMTWPEPESDLGNLRID